MLRERSGEFPLDYRSTPHKTTGRSSAELLFKRKLSTKMPELLCVDEKEMEGSNQSVRDRDAQEAVK